MNILEDFRPFLKKWCHENHLPMPEENNMNKIWQKAWQSYMDTHLTENYEEIRQQYLNMPLLTVEEYKNQEKSDNKLDTEEDVSSWSRIEKMMNEK